MIVKRVLLAGLGLLLLVGTVVAVDLSASTISNSNSWLIANDGTASTENVSTITVQVLDGLSPVSGATVGFSLSSPPLGALSSSSATTGSDGLAVTKFTTGAASGDVTITAELSYNDGSTTYTRTLMTVQQIDHGTPHIANYEYPSQGTVGSIVHLNITYSDRYTTVTGTELGNRIDNRNTSDPHTVMLTGLGTNGSGFWNGAEYVSSLTMAPDNEGNVSVDIRLSNSAGYNNIGVTGMGSDLDKWPLEIVGVSLDDPVTITRIPPAPTEWPADGQHVFHLYYSVSDPYGNGLDGTGIWINSSVNESYLATTSNGGIAYARYGPKDISGTYTITASSVKNTSIICTDTGTTGSCIQTVKYTSMEPVNMILTASPQTMVSLDVDAASKATIQARVIDVAGNPVENQVVSFTNTTESYPGAPNGKYNIMAESSISATSATTDHNGFATIIFTPGSFPGIGEPGYNATATGRKTVTATWTNAAGTITKTGTVTFLWKNYPYLSVTTQMDNSSVNVGEPIRLTITVSGNGAALQPRPIDVVLALDRSGSMLENATALEDNMVVAKSAAKTFASCLTYGKDRIGIVSFGDTTDDNGWANLSPTYTYDSWYHRYEWDWDNVYWAYYWVARDGTTNYPSYECGSNCPSSSSSGYSATSAHQLYLNQHYNNGLNKYYGSNMSSVDLAFGFNPLTNVNDALNGIVPAGGTPTREGIYTAVNQFDSSSSGRVRAIILQSDGDYTSGHNPEGGSGNTNLGTGVGTGSVITYANTSKIAMYVIGIGVDSATETKLKRYAANDAGKYYSASDVSELPEIYKQIAGELNKQAGGATTLNLEMGTLTVNGTEQNSFDYLNYTAIPLGGRGFGEGRPSDSTYVTMYHANPDNSLVQYYNYTRDDRQNWTSTSRNMNFNIGTMKLNDTWQTSMVFNVTKNGTIVLFGPDSGASLSFTDSSTNITQSLTLDALTFSSYLETVDVGFKTADLSLGNLKNITNPDPSILTITWTTRYNGIYTAKETVQYLSSEPGSQPVTLTELEFSPSASEVTKTFDIDTSTWTEGATYTISVSALARDAATPLPLTMYHTIPVSSGKTFIKLE
ncbi:VWA domain-containing protein [Methanoregula sp.]|uniref:VWA domain-containing protein n=1 Tax=Methanoregula sp. TaxID=2052170 RepID=UPI0023691918|nr:VWA domain-containing protein [Methanoregula sp.]MDD1686269.1 VWA domain-containing protein [Methanoregula sp.]